MEVHNLTGDSQKIHTTIKQYQVTYLKDTHRHAYTQTQKQDTIIGLYHKRRIGCWLMTHISVQANDTNTH